MNKAWKGITIVDFILLFKIPKQLLSDMFSFFSPLCSSQSVKTHCTENTACHVKVILSRFFFSSEVASHIAFGDASHLHSYSLVSPLRKKKNQHTACDRFSKSNPYSLCSMCVNLVTFPLHVLNSICILLSFTIGNARKHQQHNIAGTAHISLTSGRFPAKDQCQYFDFQYLNILPPQLSE